MSDGFVSIIVPAYLLLLGFDALQVGVLATATLLGSALLNLAVGLTGARRATRRCCGRVPAMGLTGLGFAAFDDFWPLLVVAFIGTLKPSAGDVSVFLPLEQALLARSVAAPDRTHCSPATASWLAPRRRSTLLAALPSWPPVAVCRRLSRSRGCASSTRSPALSPAWSTVGCPGRRHAG